MTPELIALLVNFFSRLRAGLSVSIAILGDSICMGYGANADPYVSPINGISYAYYNAFTVPASLVNWGVPAGNPYEIHTVVGPYAVISQETQDNVLIPSGIRLLETWLKTLNPDSVLINRSVSGGTADNMVTINVVASLASLATPPDVIIISTGANSAKNNQSQSAAVQTLINQSIAYGIPPILAIPPNAGADSETGTWFGTEFPNNFSCPHKPDGSPNWIQMASWAGIRADYFSQAASNNLMLIDRGNSLGTIDITKYYDPFHLNAAGYVDDSEVFKTFFMPVIPPHYVDLIPRRLTVDGYRAPIRRQKTAAGYVERSFKSFVGA